MRKNMSEGKKVKKGREQAVCQKNDIITLSITAMGAEGEGIGRLEGYTLFVKDALPGDVVRACVMKAKKRYGYARLLEIIEPSPHRVEPRCHVARQCGGCQLQHCSYGKQILWKEEKVRECLNRIGGFSVSDMDSALSMEEPYHYRNKAQFPVGVNKEGKPAAGFYAGRTHSIIENTDCIIQHPCNKVLIEAILQFMRDYKIPAYDEKKHTGLVRHILTRVGVATGDVMVCMVINGTSLPHSDIFAERLLECQLAGRAGEPELQIKSICLNVNQEKTNVILGKQIKNLYGNGFIEDKIGDIIYRISPLSFYQVNPVQTRRLYETVLEYADLHGGEVVWDLYCGIGTISLFMAQKAARVCGVEIVPQAVEDARKNAELNHLKNTEFFAGAAEEVVPEQYQRSRGSLKADVVALDPPRKGCDKKLLQTVVQMEPKRIVYVSCDPATMARDLRYLCDRGYELGRVRVCDMFGMSYHVETCVLLTHKKPTSYIEVTMDYDTIVPNQKPGRVTYKMITEYVKEKYNLVVKSTTIAEVKRSLGFEVGDYNVKEEKTNYRKEKVTLEKVVAIKDALRHFGVIE